MKRYDGLTSRKKASTMSGYAEPRRTVFLVKAVLYVQLFIAIAALLSGIYVHRIFTEDYRQTVDRTPEENFATLEAREHDVDLYLKRMHVLAWLRQTGFFASGILFLVWTFQANRNAHALGAEQMRFSPSWAVGWYFVPIANLWKPYQAMKEIWQASHGPENWKAVPGAPILNGWWLLLVTSNLVCAVAFRLQFWPTRGSDLPLANLLFRVYDVLTILLFLVMLRMIAAVQTAQRRAHARQLSEAFC